MSDGTALSETQREILDLAASGLSNAEIADQTGTHVALVRDLRRGHEGDGPSDGDTGDGTSDETSDDGSALDTDDGTLSETEVAIVETAASSPDFSNADIAVELDTTVALVRDFRESVRAVILERVARDPESTNADIAAELDTTVALVRDTRRDYADVLESLDVDRGSGPNTIEEATGVSGGDDDDGLSGTVVALALVALLVAAVVVILV